MIKENAYAKINISLDVTAARSDGYHDMLMVMQSISIHDEIEIETEPSGKISAECNFDFIPGDERNLAVKAAKLYFERLGKYGQGAKIRINKKIPVGAGMAGGSSDAAAVLRALNRAFDGPFKKEELLELAARTGSDVPFCLIGGTALAEGRGERLTELNNMPDCDILVAKPEFSISTPEFFRAIDRIKLRTHPDTKGICEAVSAGSLPDIARRMYNVFEDIPDRRLREVSEIRSRMLDEGALGAIMTGTGSAVFAVFEKGKASLALREELKNKYGFCELAGPVGRQI